MPEPLVTTRKHPSSLTDQLVGCFRYLCACLEKILLLQSLLESGEEVSF